MAVVVPATVIIVAVPMITVTTMSVPTMSMMIVRWLFRELTKRTECSGQLSRTAQQGDAGEHGHIDELSGIVADGESEQSMRAFDRRSDGTPDEHCDEHQQNHADVTAVSENGESFRPVHGKRPEANPGNEWQPGQDDQKQGDNHIEQ